MAPGVPTREIVKFKGTGSENVPISFYFIPKFISRKYPQRVCIFNGMIGLIFELLALEQIKILSISVPHNCQQLDVHKE